MKYTTASSINKKFLKNTPFKSVKEAKQLYAYAKKYWGKKEVIGLKKKDLVLGMKLLKEMDYVPEPKEKKPKNPPKKPKNPPAPPVPPVQPEFFNKVDLLVHYTPAEEEHMRKYNLPPQVTDIYGGEYRYFFQNIGISAPHNFCNEFNAEQNKMYLVGNSDEEQKKVEKMEYYLKMMMNKLSVTTKLKAKTKINILSALDQSKHYELKGFYIHAVVDMSEIKEGKKVNIEDLMIRLLNNDAKQFIESPYTRYGINKEAKTFSELLVSNNCEYVNQNFHPRCCVLTALLNAFCKYFDFIKPDGKRARKALTYERLCSEMNLEYKPSDISATLNDAYVWCKKYNFSMYVFDKYLNNIFTSQSTDTKHMPSIHICIQDDHVYTFNHNLERLRAMDTKAYDENIVKSINVHDCFPLGENKATKITAFIKNADDMTEFIKKEAGKDEQIEFNFGCNDIEFILKQVLDAGHHPLIQHDACIMGFCFSVGKKLEEKMMVRVTRFSEDFDTYHIGITNTEQFKTYLELDKYLKENIIKVDYMSFHHDSVLDIEQLYKLGPMTGKIRDTENTIYGLDMSKAYSYLLKTLRKIPKFSFWDVYEKYDNHDIEDLTLYIVEAKVDNYLTNLLLPQKHTRTFGLVLKLLDSICYKILQFRRPSEIIDVNFSNIVDNVYMDERLPLISRKWIVNKLIGILGKKQNGKTVSLLFDKPEDARTYEYMYNGDLVPLSFSTEEEVENPYDIEGKAIKLTSTIYKYLVNVGNVKRLRCGFQNIKDLIYCMQNIRCYETAVKMEKLNVPVLGLLTDCLYFPAKYEKVIIENFEMGKEAGKFKIETGKKPKNGPPQPLKLPCKNLSFEENKSYNFPDFSNVTIHEFEEEKDYKTSDVFINKVKDVIAKNPRVLIVAKYPGSGKSTCAKKYDANGLVTAPYNVLCQSIKSEDFESCTLHKLLGIDHTGQNKISKIDVTPYKTITFDEILLHSPEHLFRIDHFMKEHPDIKYCATGDLKQLGAIGFRGEGKTAIMQKIMNIMFPVQIKLNINKRMNTEEDKQKLINLEQDIFNTKPEDMFDLLVKYGFKTIDNMKDLKTTKNICFYNERRSVPVNQHVHYNILKNTKKWVVGSNVMVAESYKTKDQTCGRNFTYKILSCKKDIYELENVVDKTIINVPEKAMDKHFKLPYCFTVDSIQGTSISENFTIFDIGSPYVDCTYVWTMITRARNFSQITIFKHPKLELIQLGIASKYGYFARKIEGYISQDLKAGRLTKNDIKIDEKTKKKIIEDYIDVNWFKTELIKHEHKCPHCMCKLEFKTNDTSNITANRKDNGKNHTKSNSEICCVTCNIQMANK